MSGGTGSPHYKERLSREVLLRKVLFIMVVTLLAVITMTGCSNGEGKGEEKSPPAALTPAVYENITPEQAQKLMDEGLAVILDVREPAEYNAGHIPGSVLIPLGQLETRAQELDPNKPVVVVCRSGRRSVTGSNILVDKGFVKVMNMLGGIQQWPYQVESNENG